MSFEQGAFMTPLRKEHYFRIFHSLLRVNDTPEETNRANKVAEWLCDRNQSIRECTERHEFKLVGLIGNYYAEYGSAPSRVVLDHLVRQQSVQDRTDIERALADYDNHSNSFEAVYPAADMDMLLDTRRKDWDRVKAFNLLKNALSITQGPTVVGELKEKRTLEGWSEAVTYIAEESRKQGLSGRLNGQSEHGTLQDNAADVGQTLLARLNPNAPSYKVMTGFDSLDHSITMGPGEDVRFVLIAGGSNHGKSAILLPMIYNAAASGKNVLLVPREYTVRSAWERLLWMHQHQFPQFDPLPPFTAAQNDPSILTDHHRAFISFLAKDLAEGTTLPGRIDVARCSTWDEVVNYLEANDAKWNFDVLAIDYLSHLSPASDVRDPIEGRKQMFRAAQDLALSWKDGRGLLVISPVQANKTAVQRAGQGEGRDFGSFEGDTSCVDYYTSALHDSDLVLGVYQGNDLRKTGKIKVTCVKSRSQFFPQFMVQVDPNTRHAAEIASGQDVLDATADALLHAVATHRSKRREV